MKKIISFSLWGNNPIYTFGAIENVYLAQEIFPDWTVRIYYKNIPIGIKKELEKCNNCELILINNKNYDYGTNAMMRFKVLFDRTIDIFIIRDTDSRLCIEDKQYIDIWEKSNFDFYSLQDNPISQLNFFLQGGMWGGKKKFFDNNETINLLENEFNDWIENKICKSYYKKIEKKFNDQDFLSYKLVPLIKNNILYITTNKDIVNEKNVLFANFNYSETTISNVILNYNLLKKNNIINFNIDLNKFSKKRISDNDIHNLIIEIAKKENISEIDLINFFTIK